ncbi:MAG TPA: serine hydrolase, partial [Streptomyces sp.]|nr:serine hydrolase [Streptomyces sp.]
SDEATAVFRVPGSRTADGAVGAEDGEDGEDGEDAEDVRDEAGGNGEEGRGKESEGAESAESGEGDEDAADRDGAEAGDGTPADQITTVFRMRSGTGAERPEEDGDEPGDESGKPGDATEDKAAGEPGRAGRPEEETDAERTSRFVPLRSDDIPLAPGSTAPSAPQTPSGLPEHELTRQQPLPTAQRPLDLLAELTNKPAPPETPLRVAVRRIKIWSPLVVLLAIVLAVVQFLRPLPAPELILTASATHSFGGDAPSLVWPSEGQAYIEVEGLGPLGSYGEQKPVPIASVAKAMTAYIILRDHPLKAGEEGPKIPVDRQAEEDAGLSAQNESTVEVKEGEQITLHEALNALMIASANNVARLLARWDAGSEKAFVAKMNEAARELGMKDTTYTDPSGLRRETVSTARDQVLLGKEVMDYEVFRNIVKLPSYVDRNGDKHHNWNRLIPYDNSVGIKTGTSTAAGGNLLFAAEKQIGGTTQLIVGAVLGQYRPPIIDTVVSESRKLMLSAQDVLETEKIVRKGDVVGYVDDGLGGRTPLVVTKDVTAVGWPGLKVELALTDGGGGVPHEAPAGETVGTLTVGSGPGQVKVPVAVQEELTKPGAGARLTRLL